MGIKIMVSAPISSASSGYRVPSGHLDSLLVVEKPEQAFQVDRHSPTVMLLRINKRFYSDWLSPPLLGFI